MSRPLCMRLRRNGIRGDEMSFVAVFGDTVIDQYVNMLPARPCREDGRAPRYQISSVQTTFGAAANMVAGCRFLGLPVAFGSVSGLSVRSPLSMSHWLDSLGLADRCIPRRADWQTPVLRRYIEDGRLVGRMDCGRVLDEIWADKSYDLERFADLAHQARLLICCDHGRGFFAPAVVEAIQRGLTQPAIRCCIVNPKDGRWAHWQKFPCTSRIFVVNWAEALARLSCHIGRDYADDYLTAERAAEAAKLIQRDIWPDVVIVTLGEFGALVAFNPTGRNDGRQVVHVSFDGRDFTPTSAAVGAGDVFISYLAAHLWRLDCVPPSTADAWDACLREVVSKTSACVSTGLQGTLTARPIHQPLRVISTLTGCPIPSVNQSLEEARQRGCRIVFTNGAFDLLHAGHFSTLRWCKEGCPLPGRPPTDEKTFLIVGLNSDESIRRLKGPGRPILSQDKREAALRFLPWIDQVVIFSEDTPKNLVAELKPQRWVKGSDWSEAGVPDREDFLAAGGELLFAPLVPGISTTKLLSTIKGG